MIDGWPVKWQRRKSNIRHCTACAPRWLAPALSSGSCPCCSPTGVINQGRPSQAVCEPDTTPPRLQPGCKCQRSTNRRAPRSPRCSRMSGHEASAVAHQLDQLSLGPAKQPVHTSNAVIAGTAPAVSALRELIGRYSALTPFQLLCALCNPDVCIVTPASEARLQRQRPLVQGGRSCMQSRGGSWA